MIRVLLSLDLIDSEDQRDDFYAFLKDKNWKKTKDVDTVWTIQYSKANPDTDESYKDVKYNIATTLIEAATEFKLKKIYYVAQLGNHEVIARSITKEDGKYKCFTRKLHPE
ncbi:hypothetical protein [Pseudomonas fluorescens]|uniref:hypothetical protein n=1 Tax=Pseudomonas fluorescens TaxID=294 RepID=UPI0012494D80|nr:hypothetical protein [Pseudomonas fluorescens]CAG8870112.1 hypothetical protein PS861_03306 [Pseudomonas fluorescens]